MKSYLSIWFNSEGARPMEITDRLMGMGFRPIKGEHDYVYDWGKQATVEDAMNLIDQVHMTLKGCKVNFKLDTY
ncbi:MAG: hypothetical protein QXO69_02510 [archaeon]